MPETARHRAYLARFFSRVGPEAEGPMPGYFGCGNSLVRRAALPDPVAPFALERNHIGGEDDLLFGHMQAAGARFAWAPDAWVHEDPAPSRLTLRYTLLRAFAYGQGPTEHCASSVPPDRVGVVKWMAIGVGQALVYGAVAAVAWIDRRTGPGAATGPGGARAGQDPLVRALQAFVLRTDDMSVITDWTPEKARDFTRANLAFEHGLHERPMFDDAGLESLLDRYPRDKLGVFTMGHDPVDWQSWRRGSAGDLSGRQLLDAAKAGRIWLNLRHANDYLEDYAALEAEVFAEKTARTGVRTFKRDLGVLISSANAQVFYHLDVPLVSLWQIRGQKRVWVYPVAAPHVGAEQLEKIVLRETAEQMAFQPGLRRRGRGVRPDARQDGHLGPERAAPDRERADAECLAEHGVHDPGRADAGQCAVRQRGVAQGRGPAVGAGGAASGGAGQDRPRASGQGVGDVKDLRQGAADDVHPGSGDDRGCRWMWRLE